MNQVATAIDMKVGAMEAMTAAELERNNALSSYNSALENLIFANDHMRRVLDECTRSRKNDRNQDEKDENDKEGSKRQRM